MASTEVASDGTVSKLLSVFSAGPARPGDSYGAPGRGRSTSIAIATTIGLFLAWYLVTLGEDPIIKPLSRPAATL